MYGSQSGSVVTAWLGFEGDSGFRQASAQAAANMLIFQFYLLVKKKMRMHTSKMESKRFFIHQYNLKIGCIVALYFNVSYSRCASELA